VRGDDRSGHSSQDWSIQWVLDLAPWLASPAREPAALAAAQYDAPLRGQGVSRCMMWEPGLAGGVDWPRRESINEGWLSVYAAWQGATATQASASSRVRRLNHGTLGTHDRRWGNVCEPMSVRRSMLAGPSAGSRLRESYYLLPSIEPGSALG
jgi:hypothetical protein